MRSLAISCAALLALGCRSVVPESAASESTQSAANIATLFEHLEFAFPWPSDALPELGAATFAPTGLKVTPGLEQWLAAHGAIVQAYWMWTMASGETTVHIRDLRHERILLESKMPNGFMGGFAVVFWCNGGSDAIALCAWGGEGWSVLAKASAAGEYTATQRHAHELEVLSGTVAGRVVQGGSVKVARNADKDPTTCQVWTWYGTDAAFIADELDRFTHPNTRPIHRFATRARQMSTVPLGAWTRPALCMSAEYSATR